jgi:two-component system sensor histidine kinase CpxA
MPKTRIFIKIYLWFWLATALVIATQMTLDHLTESGPPFGHRRHEVERLLTFFGNVALEHYLRGDICALSHLADLLRESTGINAYLLDKGRDIGNRQLQYDSAELAERVFQSGTIQTSLSKDNFVVALPVSHVESGHFTIVGEAAFPPPPPPPFMRSPFAGMRILVMLLVSGLVCYGLARYLTSPIITLREATRRFAAGDLGFRVGRTISKRKDEFSELADDFNHMATQIGSLMALQKQLLTDISHELRSPLARLKVALELARRRIGTKADRELNRIEHEADLINQMIGQILTLRWIESGVEEIEMKLVDLTDMVQRIVSDAAFEAIGKNRRVILNESDQCHVIGNEELLRRAVENVVRNAIHHTPENTTVDIRVRRSLQPGTAHATIEVRDRGQGVPNCHIANIFRPFYRASDSRERSAGGVGLGLAITERSVKLHHGKVSAQNAQDGGLIVTVQLPSA